MLDLPLERIHKQAFRAAQAAHCAGDQNSYWQMHDRLFQNYRALEPLSGHAQAIGLDVAAFESCLEDGKHAAAVRADMAVARQAGASGTPSFILGVSEEGDPGKIKGLTFIRGAQPYDAFREAIEKALSDLEGE